MPKKFQSYMRVVVLSLLGCIPVSAFSALNIMTNDELNAISGQAGADFELDLRLNMADNTAGGFANTGTICGDNTSAGRSTPTGFQMLSCRVGIKILHEGNSTADFWVVLKGLSGGIYIPKLGLDGSDIKFTTDSGNTRFLSALKFTFAGPKTGPSNILANKVRFNNFGFNALDIATGEGVNTGYRSLQKYGVAGNTAVSGYTIRNADTGKETGALSVRIHGNAEIGGSITMFACTADHKRC